MCALKNGTLNHVHWQIQVNAALLIQDWFCPSQNCLLTCCELKYLCLKGHLLRLTWRPSNDVCCCYYFHHYYSKMMFVGSEPKINSNNFLLLLTIDFLQNYLSVWREIHVGIPLEFVLECHTKRWPVFIFKNWVTFTFDLSAFASDENKCSGLNPQQCFHNQYEFPYIQAILSYFALNSSSSLYFTFTIFFNENVQLLSHSH